MRLKVGILQPLANVGAELELGVPGVDAWGQASLPFGSNRSSLGPGAGTLWRS